MSIKGLGKLEIPTIVVDSVVGVLLCNCFCCIFNVVIISVFNIKMNIVLSHNSSVCSKVIYSFILSTYLYADVLKLVF